MTSTTQPHRLDGADDPAAVLAYAREQKRVEDQAARNVMRAAATWAGMHSGESLVGPVDEWHEQALPLGGEGCPEVAEFAVVEFAAALGKTTQAGRLYLAKAIEARYRLTHCWKQLEDGQLPAWKLGIIAEQTISLPPAAAAFVDAHVAHVAHKIGLAQLTRLVAEAIARYDPDRAETERLAAADSRHLDVRLDQVTTTGTVHLDGDLDLADGIDFNTALAADAHQQLLAGSTESLDVRRSIAAGNLARAQLTLTLQPADTEPTDEPAPPGKPAAKRQLVLHVHLEHAAVLGAGGLARVHEAPGPVTAEQIRLWCANPDTTVTVQPVLDLAGHLHVNSYQASSRLKLQTYLRDLVCAFPYCYRPAEQCDCEHRVTYEDGGPTCTCNQAPACRGHHRAKTTGGWSYLTVEPGVYLWRSPLGYQFLKDPTGTIDVTPDDERHKLAHELRAHFGDTGPADPEP